MTDLICDMPIRERPRERLMTRGVESLTDSELLAVLLGNGTRGVSAVRLANQLLCNGIAPLFRQDMKQLQRNHGIGLAKACRIAASFELSRRWSMSQKERPAFDRDTFGAMLVETESHHTQEHLGCLLLDGKQSRSIMAWAAAQLSTNLGA